MEKNTLLANIGFSFGTKASGISLSLKYFFIDDLGAELNMSGSPDYFKFSGTINYYPFSFNSYGYLSLGFSQLISNDKVEKDGNIYDGKCNVYGLEASAGISSKKFTFPATADVAEEDKVRGILFSELGLTKILSSQVKEVYGIIIKDDEAFEKSKNEYKSKNFANGWMFPDILLSIGFVLYEQNQ